MSFLKTHQKLKTQSPIYSGAYIEITLVNTYILLLKVLDNSTKVFDVIGTPPI